MSVRTEPWPHGTPTWADLMADDPKAASDFYYELFGWQAEEGPPETGGYRIAELGAEPVAGIGGKSADDLYPSAWTTYLAVDDLDEAVAKVQANGGQVQMGPMDVMGMGRMAVATDPTGAVVGMWQAQAFLGCRRVNEPGALIWNECMTRDYEDAKAFYAAVFGYSYDEVGDGTFKYSTFKVGDRMAGGIGELSADTPAETPAHWMAYFGTDDTDAVVGRARDGGAEVLSGPSDSPYGRTATVRGPQGEFFSVISVAAEGNSGS